LKTLDDKIILECNRFSNTLEKNNHAAELYYPGSYYAGVDKGFDAGAHFVKAEMQREIDELKEELDETISHEQINAALCAKDVEIEKLKALLDKAVDCLKNINKEEINMQLGKSYSQSARISYETLTEIKKEMGE
jgi:uncharacterized coiled-coil protein SlyX